MKHLLSISELSAEEIRYLLLVAKKFSSYVEKGEKIPLLKNKTVVNLFFENSTRTRTSFEVAARKLDGQTLNFSASTSSISKGETLIDALNQA